jgi:hypothetical protein
MSPTESDSKQIDWTAVERTVEQELLDRAKQVARRITDRVRKVTEDTGPSRKLGENDPTDESPPVG